MPETPAKLIRAWLARQLPEPALAWLDGQTAHLTHDPSSRALHTAIGLAPRKLGRDDLRLGPEDLARASEARSGWDPAGLSVDAAARILILLSLPEKGFAETFAELCRTAEVGELIAFYRGLPLYPEPERLVAQACEGLRTNMRAVFEAVAHRSPFPAEHFNQEQWNQMVLKALFIESALHLIQRLDERSNPELARMLCDYAQERWAAGRAVPLELWRCVGPHTDSTMLPLFSRALESEMPLERMAAALGLASSGSPEAAALLEGEPELRAMIAEKRLTWGHVISEMARSA